MPPLRLVSSIYSLMLSTISCPPLAPSPLRGAATAIAIALPSALEPCGYSPPSDTTINIVIKAIAQNLTTVLPMKLQPSYLKIANA